MAYRVLIVDDSPAMRAFVRRVIELSGFELSTCFEASNGQEALDLLRREWVDAILTDFPTAIKVTDEFDWATYILPKDKHTIKEYKEGFVVTGWPKALGASEEQKKRGL